MSLSDNPATLIVVAGATGGLGARIAHALRARGAAVRTPVRTATEPGRAKALEQKGCEVVRVDLDRQADLARVCEGAACVVSALNGLEHTILKTQGVLLDAAVAAGVPRFIPSDFSLDFTKTPPGSNRNLDLRRAFRTRLLAAPIRSTSILNGGFADMLAGQAPFILFPVRRVLYWGDADQPLDFTTMDDVAAFTAAAALDPDSPAILRIAGDVVTPRRLAAVAGEVAGHGFKPFRLGGIGGLAAAIKVARLVAPGRGQVFPPWQGLQYMRDMMSGDGKLARLDNARYPGLRWTSVREVLARR